MTTYPATVLLATDGSAHAANARCTAAEISARSGASLHLVRAWDGHSGPIRRRRSVAAAGVER